MAQQSVIIRKPGEDWRVVEIPDLDYGTVSHLLGGGYAERVNAYLRTPECADPLAPFALLVDEDGKFKHLPLSTWIAAPYAQGARNGMIPLLGTIVVVREVWNAAEDEHEWVAVQPGDLEALAALPVWTAPARTEAAAGDIAPIAHETIRSDRKPE